MILILTQDICECSASSLDHFIPSNHGIEAAWQFESIRIEYEQTKTPAAVGNRNNSAFVVCNLLGCSQAGEQLKRLHKTYRTRRKLEIKNSAFAPLLIHSVHRVSHLFSISPFKIKSSKNITQRSIWINCSTICKEWPYFRQCCLAEKQLRRQC
jgi:hypothetical protein